MTLAVRHRLRRLRRWGAAAARASPRSPSRSADRMKVVLDISRLLAVTDMATLLDRIGDAAASFHDAERASVFLHDPATDELWTVSAAAGEVRRPAAYGIAGTVFRSGRVAEVPHTAGEPATGNGAAMVRPQSVLCAPVRDLDRQVIGVVEVVNKRSGRFTREDHLSIELLAEHAALAIQRWRLLLAATQASEMRKEMELAHAVQAALIPACPSVPGLECAGWTRAASLTGGDCFDLWRLAEGGLGIFVGDASGHGLASALVISQARAMLRALADIDADPAWLLERLNARLWADLQDGRFVTAFAARLSPDGWLHWSSAGQGPVYLRTGGGGPFEAIPAPAVPLGVSPDLITDAPIPVRLEPGGMLVVMTDGIFEAANPAGELFGPARVAQILDRGGGATPDDLVRRLRAAVREWQGREEPADDQTGVAVRRRE